jgi:hypothetical protein
MELSLLGWLAGPDRDRLGVTGRDFQVWMVQPGQRCIKRGGGLTAYDIRGSNGRLVESNGAGRSRLIKHWDEEDPLNKVDGESKKANRALRDYAYMGPGRTLDALAEIYQKLKGQGKRPPTVSRTTIGTWCFRNRWVTRVQRWEDLEIEREEDEWRQFRRQLRLREKEGSLALLDLSAEILAEGPEFIKERVVTDKSGNQTVYLRLDGDLAVRAMEAGSKLGRLAAGLETERHTVISITAEDLVRAQSLAEQYRNEVIDGELIDATDD